MIQFIIYQKICKNLNLEVILRTVVLLTIVFNNCYSFPPNAITSRLDLSSSSVAINANGTRLVIGDEWADIYDTGNEGIVRILKKSGSSWVELESITGESAYEGFGASVAISDDGIRVAACGNFSDSGTVIRVYDLIDGSRFAIGTPIQVADLSEVGYNLAISGDGSTIAISGRAGYGDSTPFASVFKLVDNTWVQAGQDLDVNDPITINLSYDGNLVAVGNRGQGDNLCVFECDATASAWSLISSNINAKAGRFNSAGTRLFTLRSQGDGYRGRVVVEAYSIAGSIVGSIPEASVVLDGYADDSFNFDTSSDGSVIIINYGSGNYFTRAAILRYFEVSGSFFAFPFDLDLAIRDVAISGDGGSAVIATSSAVDIVTNIDFNTIDSDGDGLGDIDEIEIYGTDPLSYDTDSDGLSDGDEINRHNTDPLLADSDSDGLSDSDEIEIYGTDPLSYDTDSDGLSDDDEINRHNTDPLLADTDSDGLSDSDELNQFGTDPLDLDSDGDSVSDKEELDLGRDPIVAEYPPELTLLPFYEALEGTLITVNATPTVGTPTNFDYQWYFNGSPIPESFGGKLSTNYIVGISLNEGTYRVDVSNIAGSGSASFQFMIVGDSDEDGLTNGEEINTYNTDPSLADTDGDGLIDGDEINLHSTDPLKKDTDNDLILDGIELRHASLGFDPNIDSSTLLIAFHQAAAELPGVLTDEQNQKLKLGGMSITPNGDNAFAVDFVIEESDDLIEWAPVETLSYMLNNTGAKKFVRIRVPE